MSQLLQHLRSAGLNCVLGKADPGYPQATAGFDTAVTFAPDVVVVPQSAAEVASAVAVAADRGEPVTVSGSGHGRIADVTGGFTIAMQGLNSVEVDAAARLVRIGAGATWEPVLAATAPLGLEQACRRVGSIG